MNVVIFYKDEVLAETSGTREAAIMVASREKATNVYMVEHAIMNSILTGKSLGDYKFKLKGE